MISKLGMRRNTTIDNRNSILQLRACLMLLVRGLLRASLCSADAEVILLVLLEFVFG